MLSMSADCNIFRGLGELQALPQPPPHSSQLSQPPTIHSSPRPRHSSLCHTPTVNLFQRPMQRTPYRLSEGRTATYSHYDVSAGNPVRMAAREPLNTIPSEFYEIHPTAQSSENTRNDPERSYFGGLIDSGSNRPSQTGSGISQGNQSAPLPFIRPRLPRPRDVSSIGTAPDLGLLTFRMNPNGQSAVVIRHSEDLFQPGQVVGYQTELAFCFESKMCPICQEEWIWKIFTPAEMALLDPSGAEWEVARLPCGHAFHGACLAVWFHEISSSNCCA